VDRRHFGYIPHWPPLPSPRCRKGVVYRHGRTNWTKESCAELACLLALLRSFLSLDLPLFSLSLWAFFSVYKRLPSPHPILYFPLPSQLSELPCRIHWKPLICCYKYVFFLPDLVVAPLHHNTVTVKVLGIWRDRERQRQRQRQSVCVCVCVFLCVIQKGFREGFFKLHQSI